MISAIHIHFRYSLLHSTSNLCVALSIFRLRAIRYWFVAGGKALNTLGWLIAMTFGFQLVAVFVCERGRTRANKQMLCVFNA